MAHEDDDRERTAALLASVRASIQAERAAREEATAEPPAGLAELLRPPEEGPLSLLVRCTCIFMELLVNCTSILWKFY